MLLIRHSQKQKKSVPLKYPTPFLQLPPKQTRPMHAITLGRITVRK